jgi:hypothetical protein
MAKTLFNSPYFSLANIAKQYYILHLKTHLEFTYNRKNIKFKY